MPNLILKNVKARPNSKLKGCGLTWAMLKTKQYAKFTETD